MNWRRLLPNIRYGTERYPEKVARRLRALNITCGRAYAMFGWPGTVAVIGAGLGAAALLATRMIARTPAPAA